MDQTGTSTLIDQVVIPVQSTESREKSVLLAGKSVATKKGSHLPAKLTYSMEYREFPESSRLKGSWRVRISKVTNLQLSSGTADIFASISAYPEYGEACFQQQTTVCPKSSHPQ